MNQTLPFFLSISLLLIAPAVALQVAADPSTQPEPIQAGMHANMHVIAEPDVRYKLYIPRAYTEKPDVVFPLLINHNPSGKTRLDSYVRWADEHDVIILGIDGISNGMDQVKKDMIADAVLKDLTERGVRIHPTLRLTIGMSGGSADGVRLVRRKPQAYAGCVFMGAGLIVKTDKATDLAYFILGGAKDEWMSGDKCHEMVDKARAMGCPTRYIIEIDRQHHEAPLSMQYDALTWILELQKLRMKSLPEAERNANLAAARERMNAAPNIKDPSARQRETALLLDLDPLNAFKEEHAKVASAWTSAILALAAAEPDAVQRHAFLTDQFQQRGANLGDADRASIEKQIAELRQQPAVAAEWAIRRQFEVIQSAEEVAGIKPDMLAKVLPQWQALLKDAANTPWQPRIEHRISVVQLFIDHPTSPQTPTKIK